MNDEDEDEDEVTITRCGEAIEVIVRPAIHGTRCAFASRDAAAGVSAVLDHGRAMDLGSKPSLTQMQADTIAAEVRASRSHGR